MKRIVLGLVLLQLPICEACSQSLPEFSARIGASSTNETLRFTNGTVASSSKQLLVPNFSLPVDLFPSSHFSFVTGLEYERRGIGHSVTFFNTWILENDTIDYRFHYLSLPLLVRYRYDLGSLTPYLVAGTGANLNFDLLSTDPIVFDAIIGAGVRANQFFPLPLSIEVRYSTDLTPVYDPYMSFGLDRVNSNSLDIIVGVSF